MILDTEHYVPVLKAKRGEKAALTLIDPSLGRRITPLIEIQERRADKKPTLGGHLDTVFNGLAAALKPYGTVLLDTREIAPDGPAGAEEAFERAEAEGIPFVPVTGISRGFDSGAAVKHGGRGVAVRLTRDELEGVGLAGKLRAFVQSQGLRPEVIDLILDMGPVEDMITEGAAGLALQFLLEVPDLTRWRNLILSGSAFPRSMGVVQSKSHGFAERAEWLAWRDHVHARGAELDRVPTFSDAAIQHPEGVEGFDPVTMQASATIRYTVDESWLLIKGVSTKRVLPSEQFPQLAKQLVYGRLRGQFAGPDHCGGCRGMKAAADGAPRLGSPEAWRRLGTAHHVTTVARCLAFLHGA